MKTLLFLILLTFLLASCTSNKKIVMSPKKIETKKDEEKAENWTALTPNIANALGKERLKEVQFRIGYSDLVSGKGKITVDINDSGEVEFTQESGKKIKKHTEGVFSSSRSFSEINIDFGGGYIVLFELKDGKYASGTSILQFKKIKKIEGVKIAPGRKIGDANKAKPKLGGDNTPDNDWN